jgi:hypothetical protein
MAPEDPLFLCNDDRMRASERAFRACLTNLPRIAWDAQASARPLIHRTEVHANCSSKTKLVSCDCGHQQRRFTSIHKSKECPQMPTTSPIGPASTPNDSVIQWLLDADPSIRWQVLRDLTNAPEDDITTERAKVATEGWGAQLLALQAPDGTWGGAAFNQECDSTMHVLFLLWEMGLAPDSPEAQRAVGLVRDQVTWRGCAPEECHNNSFFAGEVEPCINGQVAAPGAYFGQEVQGIINRLLSEQLADGGWNCEAENGSTRSSFNTTICVLEALLEYELAGGSSSGEAREARLRGQDYLLERHLLRRKTTGEVIERDREGSTVFTRFAFPTWWHYDVLRGLDYLRRASVTPDERVAEAVALVESKRDGDGQWPLDVQYPGAMPVDFGEREGEPSRWNTLRALRVLDWYSARM